MNSSQSSQVPIPASRRGSLSDTVTLVDFGPSPKDAMKGGLDQKNALGCVPTGFKFCIFSLLLFAFSSSVTIVSWILRNRLHNYLTDVQNALVSVYVLTSLTLAAASLFGILASVSRHHKLSSIFCAVLVAQLLVSIASGVACLVLLFSGPSKEEAIRECIAAAPAISLIKGFCQRTVLAKALCINFSVMMWILQLLTFFAGNRHTAYLRGPAEDMEAGYASDDDHWRY